jgi:hypothetical protein
MMNRRPAWFGVAFGVALLGGSAIWFLSGGNSEYSKELHKCWEREKLSRGGAQAELPDTVVDDIVRYCARELDIRFGRR